MYGMVFVRYGIYGVHMYNVRYGICTVWLVYTVSICIMYGMVFVRYGIHGVHMYNLQYGICTVWYIRCPYV